MPRISWVIWQSCSLASLVTSICRTFFLITYLLSYKHNTYRRKLDISVFIPTQHWYQLVMISELSTWHPLTKVFYRVIHHDTIALQYHQYTHTFDGRKLHDCLLNLKHLFSEFSENDNRWLCITRTCPLIPKTSVRRPNILKESSEPTAKISLANKIGLDDLHSALKLRSHSFVHPYKPVKTS